MLTVSLQYINCRLNYLDSLIFSTVLFYFFQSTIQKALIKITEFSCSAQYTLFNQSENHKFNYIIQSNLYNCTFLLSKQAIKFSKSEDCKLFYIIQYILCDFRIN